MVTLGKIEKHDDDGRKKKDKKSAKKARKGKGKSGKAEISPVYVMYWNPFSCGSEHAPSHAPSRI